MEFTNIGRLESSLCKPTPPRRTKGSYLIDLDKNIVPARLKFERVAAEMIWAWKSSVGLTDRARISTAAVSQWEISRITIIIRVSNKWLFRSELQL